MKKLIAMLLCLAMVLSIVACGAAPASSSEAAPASSEEAAPASSEEAAPASSEEAAPASSEEAAPAEEGPKVDENGLTTEEITLQWRAMSWTDEQAAEMIAAWEEVHPNIHVVYTNLSGSGDQQDNLKNFDIMLASGEVVDITYYTIMEEYMRWMNDGALPIDEYIAQAGDDYVAMFGEGAKAACSFNGSIYGIPWANNTFKVFYNKTLMDEKGITIPDVWSIEEFTEIAQQLNDPENGFYGCVIPSTWTDLPFTMAENSGWEHVVRDEAGNIVPNYDDPRFRKVCQWLYDIAETWEISPSKATIQSESLNRRAALASGKTAMIMDGPYTLVWMNRYQFNDPAEPLDFELGVAELPYLDEDGKEVTFGEMVGAWYVPKTSAYPREAYEFCKFMAVEYADKLTYMPAALTADLEAAAINGLDTFTDEAGVEHTDIYPEGVALKAVDLPFENFVAKWGKDYGLAAYYNIGLTVLDESLSLYLGGEKTLDEFVDYMNETVGNEIKNANF